MIQLLLLFLEMKLVVEDKAILMKEFLSQVDKRVMHYKIRRDQKINDKRGGVL